jgi:hypothetical protein
MNISHYTEALGMMTDHVPRVDVIELAINKLTTKLDAPIECRGPTMLRLSESAKRIMPLPLKRAISNYLESRKRKRLFGDLAPLVPKVDDMFEGPANLDIFKANGEEFLTIYKEICGLRPEEKMLDVGCGIGRKTLPLTRYFTERAAYDGMGVSGILCVRRFSDLPSTMTTMRVGAVGNRVL